MKEDILIPPTGGWSAATLYIAVNPNAEAQKRKREEEVTQDTTGVNITNTFPPKETVPAP